MNLKTRLVQKTIATIRSPITSLFFLAPIFLFSQNSFSENIISHGVFSKEVYTEVIINKSKEDIWKAILNTKLYPEWSEFLAISNTKIEKDKPIHIKVRQKNKDPMSFKPIVTSLQKEKLFKWKGNIIGLDFLFRGVHYFELKEISKNQTLLIHGEKFSGLLLPLIWDDLSKTIIEDFSSHNYGLKNYMEKRL